MVKDLQTHVETSVLNAVHLRAQTRLIYDRMLAESPHLAGGNFTALCPSDLERLFGHYDQVFFRGQIGRSLGDVPLHFRLSKRMTRSAGKLTLVTSTKHPSRQVYEITVSTTLLFHCFGNDDHRPISVNGRPCQDRLEALQRILEHEMVHLVEMLVWTTSRCSARRFQSIASRLFGHTEHTHTLITPRERALTKFGVKPGDRVGFHREGVRHTGRVNRITTRATVLVEDAQGVRYSDGNRYATFYVPLELLEPVPTGRPTEE